MTTTAQRDTLIQLSDEMLALDALLMESGGEITPEIEEWMAEYEQKFADKGDSIGWYWRALEVDIAVLEPMAAKLTVRRNALKRIKEYALFCLTKTGRDRVKGAFHEIYLQNNGGVTGLELQEPYRSNPALLPERFRKVAYMPDMDAIKAEMKDGAVREGIVTVALQAPRGMHVRLR